MEQPLVSVIIPVYNCERFITEAVRSVLDQTYKNVEVIVVNDGSTDSTLAKLERFGDKITIISQENQGQAFARNVGLRHAKGTIIGLLDADDVWPPNHIKLMLPHLIGPNPVDFTRGLTRYVKNIGAKNEEQGPAIFLEPLVGACLYNRSMIFDKLGLFDETLREGEDFDWSIRIIESGCKEKRVEEVTLWYRRHDTNLTNNPAFITGGQLNAFQKKLQRMRDKNK